MANNKKRKSSIKWLILLLVIVLLLAWFEGWIPGIGSGREVLSRRLNSGAKQVETTIIATEAQTAEHRILLKKDQITLDDKVVTLEELARTIKLWPAETKVQLIEEDAIKDTYDQVVKLLDEQQIKH